MFRKLKKIFTKESILAASDLDKKIRIEVDASVYAIEGILWSVKMRNKDQ